MFLIRMTLRAFVLGFVVGVLFAPRSGDETRRLLRERFQSVVNQLLELGGLPPVELQTSDGAPRPRQRGRRAEESGAGTTSG